MDPKLLEMLFIALSNGVALFIGSYLARRASELGDKRRADQEERVRRHRDRRAALLERLSLQRRAFDEYTRLVVKWSSPPGPAVGASAQRARQEDFAADQDSISLYAQMASAFGNRQFAEQAGATLQAARAGRDNAQVLPFSVQIVSACYQEMLRAISELEKELGLPAPRSPARPFLPDEELAKETTRLFSRDVLQRSGFDLGMVDQIFDRVRASQTAGESESTEVGQRIQGTASVDGVLDEGEADGPMTEKAATKASS